jgi:hypothetical protein
MDMIVTTVDRTLLRMKPVNMAAAKPDAVMGLNHAAIRSELPCRKVL